MIIERNKNEIMVRFKAGNNASKVQSILNYLRYVEITANSVATEADIDKLLDESKKGRWERVGLVK
jgi:hypothetical protein